MKRIRQFQVSYSCYVRSVLGAANVTVVLTLTVGLWCKLKPTERSVKLRLVSDCELGSSRECRVPQFRHRRIAPAELARLELSLLDLLC
jgi:hypothetical protein